MKEELPLLVIPSEHLWFWKADLGELERKKEIAAHFNKPSIEIAEILFPMVCSRNNPLSLRFLCTTCMYSL